MREEENQRDERRVGGGALVCDVHGVRIQEGGVACFKPEKKAKWKHVNARSLFIQGGTCLCHHVIFYFYFFVIVQVASSNSGTCHLRSASGLELKAAGVTTGPLIQHRWTPMTRLYALLRLFPDREY